MSYTESRGTRRQVKVVLTCDARKGRGVCGNTIGTEGSSRQWAQRWFFFNGWRVVSGNQVCPDCLKKSNLKFTKKVAA